MDVGNPSNFPRTLALFGNDFEGLKAKLGGKSYTDEETRQAMRELRERYGYVADPHGAVGYLGLRDYLAAHAEGAPVGVFLETAHPAKFIDVVEETLGEEVPLPEALAELRGRKREATPLPYDYDAFRSYLLAAYASVAH
jgi:threonine synthase